MKRNKGITLIALVITIIILIILAVVSINLLIGENGILQIAGNSALQYSVSKIQDDLEMIKGTVAINGKRINLENYLEELENLLGSKYSIVNGENNGIEAKITIDGKYNFLLKDTQDNNVVIIYEGNISELKLSKYNETVKYNKSTTFTIIENESGGALSVESENNALVTATLNGNEVTVNVVGAVQEETEVKVIVKSAPNGRYGEVKTIFTVKIPITDEEAPTATITIADGITSETLPITAQVTVAQSDNENLAINSCKYVLNTSGTELGTNAVSYTGGTFTSENEILNLSLSDAGTYYLHVLSVDEEGNKKETIKPITVEIKAHQHVSSCYRTYYYYKYSYSYTCWGSRTYHDSAGGNWQYTCNTCGDWLPGDGSNHTRWATATGSGYSLPSGATVTSTRNDLNCSKTYDYFYIQ